MSGLVADGKTGQIVAADKSPNFVNFKQADVKVPDVTVNVKPAVNQITVKPADVTVLRETKAKRVRVKFDERAQEWTATDGET